MALSNSERQRRYIARLKAARGAPDKAAAKRIAELERELTRAKKRIVSLERARRKK